MSLSRFLLRSAAAALIGVGIPAAAHAQGWKTACKDGTTTTATGANACDAHGGINKARTAVTHRTPSHSTKASEPARVSQAGTPAPARTERPKYEERRGWRWGRRHEEEKREDKHRRVRCRDGQYDTVVGKGHEVCKHHHGVAH